MSLVRTRTQAYLSEVSLAEMSGRDLEWLDKSVEKDYHEISLVRVVDDIAAGFATLWRMGDFEGVVLTEIILFGEVKYLCVLHVAGVGFLKNLDSIEETLVEYGRKHHCKAIEFTASRPALHRLYTKKYKEITRSYVREL